MAQAAAAGQVPGLVGGQGAGLSGPSAVANNVSQDLHGYTLMERSGQPISTDREFVGQGLSNVVGGFFQCYVSCGSLNRSMPNIDAGARTPLAAVFSALLLLALIALSAPLLARIPHAAIAGDTTSRWANSSGTSGFLPSPS